MKILNLYAGIGGNRKLWGPEHEVTAVENVDYIADVYAHFYPQDTLVREDAHQYLLDHHREFDFIWSSPPCPTHSRLSLPQYAKGNIRYPDMRLYQEIIFLRQWGGRDGRKWVVENVKPYYKPLIEPTVIIDRHFFWSNFEIPTIKMSISQMSRDNNVAILSRMLGIVLPVETKDKRKLLRNVANPETGLHILEATSLQSLEAV